MIYLYILFLIIINLRGGNKMERIYNKLVRDNIPSIIKGNGATPITRILNEEEYKKELEKKLYEEYNEVLEASGEDRVEELADMIEVIKYLAKLEGKELGDVIKTADEKSTKRGTFNDKIFLEKVIEDK
jgi:predicted house-cleaning noncanonical NTP pyrophosphatase (MazG superfamily)